MKNILLFIAFAALLYSCNNAQTKEGNRTEYAKEEIKPVANTLQKSNGYELMVQKCYICHFERPNPSKRDIMIAPPMLRVQEHYKPAFPQKEAFIKAIMDIVKEPSEENTLMPGAVKKFKLMPKLPSDEADLKLIAEALYEHDFGQTPKKGRGIIHGSLRLNDGKKWNLKDETMATIATVVKNINNFKSGNLEDYNQLGKDIFNDAKEIMLDKEYSGDLFEQIHIFFGDMEENMHLLMSAQSIEIAEKKLSKIKQQLKDFYTYFE